MIEENSNVLDSFEDLLDPQEGNEQQTTQEVEGQNLQEGQEGQEGQESTSLNEEQNTEESTLPDYSDNSVYSFLQQRGVKDPSKIHFDNEDGGSEDVDFNSLSVEDQIEILNQVTDPGLSENEINTINYLRQNGNVSLEQVIDYFSQQRLEAYLNEHPESVHQKTYTIDDYTDDELYIIKLKEDFPNFSDEELTAKLDSAKSNENLFKKETEAIRAAYKANEDQMAKDAELKSQQEIQDFRNSLNAAAGNFNEIQLDYTDDKSGSLVVEDSDKQKMISYIVDQDSEGKSQLIRDLENPDTLIELAWFRTQGADALSGVTKYWKGVLSKERQENKNLKAQLDQLKKQGSSSIIVPQDPSNKYKNNGESIWDNSGLI